MSSIEDLSDIELRKKLSEYGFPVGPVTSTTRKLFEKKLAKLMSENAKPNTTKVNRSLSRFSSAEEDSDDTSVISRSKSTPLPSAGKRKSSGRSVRATEAARQAQQAHRELNDNLLMPSPPTPPAKSVARQVRPSRKTFSASSPIFGSSNGFESGSDSDAPFSSPSSTPGRLSPRKSQALSPQRDEDEEDEDDKPIASLLSNVSDKFLRNSESARRITNDSGSEVGKRRLHVGGHNPVDTTDAPYLSAFARRLSQLKAHSIGSGHNLSTSPYDDVKESDASSDDSFRGSHSVNGNYYRRSTMSPKIPARRVDPTASFKTAEETVSFWKNSHVVSLIILGVFALFAVGLAMLYLSVTAKEPSGLVEESGIGNVYKICKEGMADEVPGVSCVTQEMVAPAMKIFETLYQELLAQSIKAECGPPLKNGSYVPPFLTEGQAVQVIVQHKSMSIWEAEDHVANLVVLLASNPHWGVSVLDSTVRHPERTKLLVSNPKIPLECFLLNKAYDLFSSFLFIVFGVTLCYGFVHGTRLWMAARERKQQVVYHYVERIIEILASFHQNSSVGGDAYLAVSHVRDQLISPQDRKKLQTVWDAAVDFIERKESRVRTEIQPVNGEDYKVWRWLPPKHSNTSLSSSTADTPETNPHTSVSSRHRKVWQGQAFGTTEGSVNNLPVSPTPCLKVRHMFDPDMETGDNWPQQVQDAILEKCEGVKILHIAVEKGSKEGCVYVKCASEPDAGKAYKALHGSWFDSKLVTVKYLRLERYHERFPLAVNAIKALRPSNNLRLSVPDED